MMTASSFDIAPNADDAIDDVDMEKLRAKYSRPREQLIAEANAKGYANAEPNKAFGQSDALADIIMCQACAAQGTVKKQYGYRVIDEQCETCAGEGVVKKGLAKKASDELKAKCKRVNALVEACEDLDELEKLEAALSKKTAVALDEVLAAYEKTPPAAAAVDVSEEGGGEAGVGPSADGVAKGAAPSGTTTMTAEELKALEAEELKKKQESERKKAAEQEERDAKNAARDAEIAAKGKRAAGGVHKFDPDEVDVHGGNATADDFMDAFGF